MADTEQKPKKGGLVKLIGIAVVLLLLIGGGVGAGMFFAMRMGGAKAAAAPADNEPHLVPKSEEVRVSAAAGSGSETSGGTGSKEATPAGDGGARYASTYYEMDKDFTSNLQDSVHYIQVGIAVSTPYDQRVIDNLKTHEIAVRSAILMALGDTTEDEVFTSEGKKQLQKRLVDAINQVLIQKEGFGGISNVYFTNFVVQ